VYAPALAWASSTQPALLAAKSSARRTLAEAAALGELLVLGAEARCEPAAEADEDDADGDAGWPLGQRRQAGRQFRGRGHPRPVDEDRDDLDTARQGRLDLDADEVVRPGSRGQPLVADEREEHIAGRDRGRDHVGEVVPELNRVDVPDDLLPAEMPGQPVGQPRGLVRRIGTPVADEYAPRHPDTPRGS